MIDHNDMAPPDDTIQAVFHSLLQSFSAAQLHSIIDDTAVNTPQYPYPVGMQTPPPYPGEATESLYTSSPGFVAGDRPTSLSPSPRLRQRQRRRSSNNRRQAVPRSTPEQPALPLADRDRRYLCGYCQEQGIHKACTRRNDLKRHIGQFHLIKKNNVDRLFLCSYPTCGMVFDFPSAHANHVKEYHSEDGKESQEGIAGTITCCTRTVFGCGFEGCMLVFEAEDPNDVEVCLDRYLQHVVKHYTDIAVGDWTYSARIRSLLTQSSTAEAWLRYTQTHNELLSWDPQETVALRKILETRHFNDPEEVVRYAVAKSMAHIDSFNGPELHYPILSQCSACNPPLATTSSPHLPESIPEPMSMFVHQYPDTARHHSHGGSPPQPPLQQSFQAMYLPHNQVGSETYLYTGSPMLGGESPMVNGNAYFTMPASSDLV
ncbi:hypothetical protein VHEMI03152 [[Torrubiella] hemipterigena]|uniref:C2H2-type domain-containing protein n=1 Tax=[Torrubiella] hemipterigena TaxID=1531966 RepID=A0A0A1SRU3_9HYPO|nr:hypothetical protein VHEMI03152 [[Torrubiella] hemipterigena]